jgi:hypothetical protein
MKMNPALTPIVKTCISVRMPEGSEGEGDSNVALALVLDVSNSTVNSVSSDGGSDNQIFKAIKAAAKQVVDLLRDGDQVAVITFDRGGKVALPFTVSDTDGKEAALSAIEDHVFPQGGTDYNAGLDTAMRELVKIEGMTRAIAFISDGAHEKVCPDPRPMATEIRESGIVIYTASVADNLSAEDETRLKEMSGGANFKPCASSFEVGRFFQGALRKAIHASVTNARLEFTPIGLVQEVAHCEFVWKNGKRNYVLGANSPAVVQLGEIGPGDRLDVFVQFVTKMPKFPDGVDSQERTFGKLVVYGACSSMGINDPIELASDEMRQRFAKVTGGKVNSYVEKIAAQADAARSLDQASKTTDAKAQQDILGKAAERVRRATQVFTDDADLAGSLTDLDQLRQESASKGGAATAKKAGRATQVFTDDE